MLKNTGKGWIDLGPRKGIETRTKTKQTDKVNPVGLTMAGRYRFTYTNGWVEM